eukprot:1892779-Rhodomonas_salina.1
MQEQPRVRVSYDESVREVRHDGLGFSWIPVSEPNDPGPIETVSHAINQFVQKPSACNPPSYSLSHSWVPLLRTRLVERGTAGALPGAASQPDAAEVGDLSGPTARTLTINLLQTQSCVALAMMRPTLTSQSSASSAESAICQCSPRLPARAVTLCTEQGHRALNPYMMFLSHRSLSLSATAFVFEWCKGTKIFQVRNRGGFRTQNPAR